MQLVVVKNLVCNARFVGRMVPFFSLMLNLQNMFKLRIPLVKIHKLQRAHLPIGLLFVFLLVENSIRCAHIEAHKNDNKSKLLQMRFIAILFSACYLEKLEGIKIDLLFTVAYIITTHSRHRCILRQRVRQV